MKRLALAIAALAAAPALAQPPTDWTKPVTGVDAPAAPVKQTIVQKVDLALVAGEADLAATPLPPPCEPPLPRAPAEPPGPPAPAPAPCRP
jgi:hypothetical protein